MQRRQLIRLRVVVAIMDANLTRVPVWTGLDITPGAWEAWRIAVVGIAGEKGLYDLIAPGEQADVKLDSLANRNLWFLLATGSLVMGVVREFEGLRGMPDRRRAWRRL